MKLLLLSLLAAGSLAAAPKAQFAEAEWIRHGQTQTLQYTHLGSRTRIDTSPVLPADAFLILDTEKDQRITVFRHNSSWKCDPVEPPARTAGQMPGMPPPPAGIGPQGTIGARGATGNSPAEASGLSPSGLPQPLPAGAPTAGVPAAGVPNLPPGIGPQYGVRASHPTPAVPPGVGPQSGSDGMPAMPPGIGPQPNRGMMPGMPAGVGPQPNSGGLRGAGAMPMERAAMAEPALTLVKTEETQKLCGLTATKYTLQYRGMETLEVWAVPEGDLGPFFAYRPHSLHRFGPVDLQDQWDTLLRKEHLFPVLAIFRQADREVAQFKIVKIETRDLDDAEGFFSPPATYYHCPPDRF
jgi:hypothetical protein